MITISKLRYFHPPFSKRKCSQQWRKTREKQTNALTQISPAEAKIIKLHYCTARECIKSASFEISFVDDDCGIMDRNVITVNNKTHINNFNWVLLYNWKQGLLYNLHFYLILNNIKPTILHIYCTQNKMLT